MELHQVRYFLALSETLNFTRAAERCNVTQPSLTRAIHALEDEFGGPLIHRERANTHLTDLGQLVRPYLEHIYRESQEAKHRAREFTSLKASAFGLGIMCTIGPHRLVSLMQAFQDRHPGIDIEIKDANARSLQEMLDQGAVDVAIFALPGGIPERYHALPLYRERFVIAFAPGHRFEKLNAVRAKDLNGERYLNRANCEFNDHVAKIYDELGIELHRAYRSERDDWILNMALAGLGFSFIPEYSISVSGLITRPLIDPEFERLVQLVTVRGRPHSAAVGAFVREAKLYPWSGPTLH